MLRDVWTVRSADDSWAVTHLSWTPGQQISAAKYAIWAFFPPGGLISPRLIFVLFNIRGSAATFTWGRHASKEVVFFPGCWSVSSLEVKDLTNFSCSVSDPGVLCKQFFPLLGIK